MTQLPFPAPRSPLAARVLAWARERGPVRFWELTDAFPGVSASDVDQAAKEAGVLRWVGSEGVRGRFDVCADGAEGVET
jgi:hypothetical protein